MTQEMRILKGTGCSETRSSLYVLDLQFRIISVRKCRFRDAAVQSKGSNARALEMNVGGGEAIREARSLCRGINPLVVLLLPSVTAFNQIVCHPDRNLSGPERGATG